MTILMQQRLITAIASSFLWPVLVVTHSCLETVLSVGWQKYYGNLFIYSNQPEISIITVKSHTAVGYFMTETQDSAYAGETRASQQQKKQKKTTTPVALPKMQRSLLALP